MANKILFGITGSISAFKAISLIRLFIKDGYQCRVIITKAGQEFIKTNLLAALGCQVYTDDSLDIHSYEQNMAHINLSRWADKIIVVPASANSIAKFSIGLADDLLSQCLLANDQNHKVYIAPAMNVNMWQNKLLQKNITKLQSLEFNIIFPDEGLQACGDIGSGRLHEPEKLYEILVPEQDLKSKKVLITVGATVENIDGVRYLSNHSSGKMGFAFIKELLTRGAEVTVLKAQVSIDFNISHSKLTIVDALSADQMNQSMLERAENCNIFIGCAAVVDYKIKEKFINKIKKDNKTLTLEFTQNPDILANCKKQFPKIFAIGFAVESENIVNYAKVKLKKKNLDMIVANSTSTFGKDNSSITILSNNTEPKTYINKSKNEIAKLTLNIARGLMLA